MRIMTKGLCTAFVVAALLAVPMSVSIAGSSDEVPTETLWKIECSGIGG